MKQIFIAGNWKSNKSIVESKAWLEQFKTENFNLSDQIKSLTVVVCAPFTALPAMRQALEEYALPLMLGAQNISPFDEGAYTGEVTGKMIKEVADWVIIGHSERRKYFGETDEMLKQKTDRAKSAGLKVIYCVPDESTTVPPGVDVVAYEPVWAIGTGKTDTPQNASAVVTTIKTKTGVKTVIYGGSVTADNVASFVGERSIDGVLPGGASLKTDTFVGLIQSALTSE